MVNWSWAVGELGVWVVGLECWLPPRVDDLVLGGRCIQAEWIWEWILPLMCEGKAIVKLAMVGRTMSSEVRDGGGC